MQRVDSLEKTRCWEGLGAGGEGDDRGWDGWMASPTRWTRVWVDPGSWWWTGRPGVLRFIGSQRVRPDWATKLNWTAFPSIRVFSSESALHVRWPKYYRFSMSPSSEYSGLLSFRIDWFELLVFQGTLKSLLQHYNLKASVLWCSAFFVVQLSDPYMTTVKTTALFIWTFVGKMMSLLFNLMSRFVMVPRIKRLLIS